MSLREVLAIAFVVVGLTGTAASAATIQTVYNFTGGTDGSEPVVGLVHGPDGALYGAATGLSYEGPVFQLKQGTGGAWVVTPIYSYTPNDGPPLSMVGTTKTLYLAFGDLYGKPCPGHTSGCGEIVELTPPVAGQTAWTATAIYNFAGGKDGVFPAGITIGPKGVIYGSTEYGGGSFACGSDNNIPTGCGTIFKLKNVKGTWTETVLHRFNGKDGEIPEAAPSLDAAGNVYVSTNQGGQAGGSDNRDSCDGFGVYVELKITHGAYRAETLAAYDCTEYTYGTYLADRPFLITLPLFSPQSGKHAINAMIATATGGGDSSACSWADNLGCGTIYLLQQPAGGGTPWTYKSIHVFEGPSQSDGYSPAGALLPVGSDAIYGVAAGGAQTQACSANDSQYGCGVIYRLDKDASGWKWGGIAYTFQGGANGAYVVPLLTSYKGMILGVTGGGGTGTNCGSVGCGTIFVFKP